MVNAHGGSQQSSTYLPPSAPHSQQNLTQAHLKHPGQQHAMAGGTMQQPRMLPNHGDPTNPYMNHHQDILVCNQAESLANRLPVGGGGGPASA